MSVWIQPASPRCLPPACATLWPARVRLLCDVSGASCMRSYLKQKKIDQARTERRWRNKVALTRSSSVMRRRRLQYEYCIFSPLANDVLATLQCFLRCRYGIPSTWGA